MLAVFNYGHQDEAYPTPDLNQLLGTAVTRLLDTFGAVRNYGPHGLQLAQVGAGRLELFYQEGLDTYNWLAGILIAREAGATVLNAAGQPWHWGDESLVVAAPGVAEKLFQGPTAAQAVAKTAAPLRISFGRRQRFNLKTAYLFLEETLLHRASTQDQACPLRFKVLISANWWLARRARLLPVARRGRKPRRSNAWGQASSRSRCPRRWKH